MRKTVLILFVLFLLYACRSSTSYYLNSKPIKELPEQVMELLKDYPYKLKGDTMIAKILFTVNRDKEIVVLTVEAENEVLETFIKERLNYKDVRLKDYIKNQRYVIQVKIIK